MAAGIKTDYLIVGAGAMGMAFADEILTRSGNTRITMVDRRAKPGGHWVDAYPFVTLHQPAAFYGVNSVRLGTGGADLSTRSEILAYYERVLKRLEGSGRLRFLPLSEYRGEGRVVSLADEDRVTEIEVHRRIVDGGYMNVEVPATHPPRYAVDEAVALMPPNALASLKKAWRNYVVIGGGKTGIDAILFLLDAGVDAGRIQWIVPNDMWLWNRALVQPGIAIAELMRHVQAIIECSSVDEIFLRLEGQGSMLRIDPQVMPAKWRCATVDEAELQALRTVKNMVRAGRVQRITQDEIQMQRGSVSTDAQTLHIDCTANGLAAKPVRALFSERQITLQSVFMCQQVFSAALLARLELMNCSDAERNALWHVIPHPESTADMPDRLIRSLENLLAANRHMPVWLRRSRLNVAAHEPLHRYAISALRLMWMLPRAQASVAQLGTV